ncbi:MAG: RNA polymerase sigma factor [Ignavibacteriae bacterium]|nr:RNA polymerase sigma factor [Ignavibacteriota bacterium]MCB9215035.1 RNA polymerase sigma factor [Ignavibacteria bacterium]
MSRARSGDHAAFRLLVNRYEPIVASTVQGMLGRGSEAEDVGQETFIRFYHALDSFREDSTLKTYLTRIAINLSLNELKRRKKKQVRFTGIETLEERDFATSGNRVIDENERKHLVRKAIDRLDPKHKAVVVLRMLNGYSTKETADLLNLPQGTVLSRLSRGMKSLEQLLKPYIANDEKTGTTSATSFAL